MGFKKVPTIYTLEFGGDYEGLIVRMKSTPVGKVRRLLGILEDDDTDTMDVVDGIVAFMAEHIVSWNMEDDNGPVEPDVEGLNAQELPFLFALSNRYLENITGPSEELGKGSPAGPQFPGQPLTMEAL